jgi:CRISPR-associated exonuclease Cas4
MDNDIETPEYIPFSFLNAYAYCPRRFYYEFTEAEMLVNEHVLGGTQLHERVDTHGQSTRGEIMQVRRLYLCAPQLGLSGYCDLVEMDGATDGEEHEWQALARAGRLYPVEYKKGKMGRWISDHVQLCAQALALEEVLDVPAGSIAQGYLFYFGSARREIVPLGADLRAQTQALLAAARRTAGRAAPPPPITNWRKCRDCSLEPICLPREVLGLQAGTLKGRHDGDPIPD